MDYNVIDNNNGTLTLVVAVPGLRKEDLQLTHEDGVLTLKTADRYPQGYKFIYRGIKEVGSNCWDIPLKYRIETANCGDGMLSVLLVPNEAHNNVIKIK